MCSLETLLKTKLKTAAAAAWSKVTWSSVNQQSNDSVSGTWTLNICHIPNGLLYVLLRISIDFCTKSIYQYKKIVRRTWSFKMFSTLSHHKSQKVTYCCQSISVELIPQQLSVKCQMNIFCHLLSNHMGWKFINKVVTCDEK